MRTRIGWVGAVGAVGAGCLVLATCAVAQEVAPGPAPPQEVAPSREIGAPLRGALRLGGSGDDRGYAVAVAPDGAFVIGGCFSGDVDFGAGRAGFSLQSAPGDGDARDAFVAAYAADGACRWAIGFGGPLFDGCFALALAPARSGDGAVVAAGQFQGEVDFDPGAGETVLESAERTGFVARFGADGSFRWARAVAFESPDVAVDGEGRAFAAGFVRPTAGEDPRAARAVLRCFDPDGETRWTRDLAGCGVIRVAASAAGGCVAAAGFGFEQRIVVARFAADGAEQRLVTLDCGAARAVLGGVAADTHGSLALAFGLFPGAPFDVDPGPEEKAFVAEREVRCVVARYDSAGRLLDAWDAGALLPHDVTFAGTGDVAVAGMHILQPGRGAALVAYLSAAGQPVWQCRLQPRGEGESRCDDIVHALGADGEGRVTAIGRFGEVVSVPGTNDLESAGNHDIVVLRLGR